MRPIRPRDWHRIYTYPRAGNTNFINALTNPVTVSIIVPNYNHAPYLRKRLDSIYQQTYPHTHVILLDDASSDDSRNILSEYAHRYPNKTTCHFNDNNSGGVFHQWLKGFEAATGDLIWIAESDDYCTLDFLEKLVVVFENHAVRIAFCRTEFVEDDNEQSIWNTQNYLHDLRLRIWDEKFIASAHALTKHAWVDKNVIPNVSSCIFRHPHQLPLLYDKIWKSMRLCGDWIFYLALARGGLVGYDPSATNYYRQHATNTSVTAHRKKVYYQEHRIAQDYLAGYYQLHDNDLDRLKEQAYKHWCIHKGFGERAAFEQIFDNDITTSRIQRRLNIAIATYALVAGGGETLPLMLANLLHQRGHAVTVIDFNQLPAENGIRSMLSPDIPLLTLSNPLLLPAIVKDMGINIFHSQHSWVDMTAAALLSYKKTCKHVVTLHGMYEMMAPELLASLQTNLEKVDTFVYTAAKNLTPFSAELQIRKRFKRINNAILATSYTPFERSELGINADDFVLCMVARGRADKGWREAIESVLLANASSERSIRLLLIGDGEEPERLKPLYFNQGHIHFLGFQSQIRSFLSSSDMGFIPSRFPGESFPLVLIDSLMCGKPVLASAIGEIETMLATNEGPAGIVFPLEDWQISIPKLAELISSIANDREHYRCLLRRVDSAACNFDPNRMVKEYEHLYNKLCTTIAE